MPSSTKINCVVNLMTAPAGLYRVTVLNSDGLAGYRDSAFHVL